MKTGTKQPFQRQGCAGMYARLSWAAMSADDALSVELAKDQAASGQFEDVEVYRTLLLSLMKKYNA